MNAGSTYKVRIDGLVKDRLYTIDLAQILGASPTFVLRDPSWLVYKTLHAPATYTFKAKSASHRIEISLFWSAATCAEHYTHLALGPLGGEKVHNTVKF